MPNTKQTKQTRKPGEKRRGGGYYRAPGLRALREELGVSHRDLLARSGISRTTLYYLENDMHLAREDTIFRLAEALGVSPLDLVIDPPEEGDGEIAT